ncbi:MAG: prepilin-type N-terminal cleavage/methylation domain-containing protein [Rhodospirillaceae bacterium]
MTMLVQHSGKMTFHTASAGFTLVELMVVVVVIGILAGLGIPYYSSYVYASRVKQAVPLLNKISDKERIYYNRMGTWFGSITEDTLHSNLGIDLTAAGDFCFVVSCQVATNCTGGAAVGPAFAATGNTPSFQVVAYLRNKAADYYTAGNRASCLVTTGKSGPMGWATTGQSVVLSYPPPADGWVSGLLWRNGMSFTNALAN